MAQRGWHHRHRAPRGRRRARGFPDTSSSVLAAVREAGVRSPASAAEEEAQSGMVTRPGLHIWHVGVHLCDFAAESPFSDTLPLSSSPRKRETSTNGGGVLAFWALVP